MKLSWQMSISEGATLITFVGVLDEESGLEALPPLSGKVTFDLSGVSRMNSDGIRRWINFLRSLVAVNDLTFVRCSVPAVRQLNFTLGFQGKAKVESFYAPYACVETGEEEERLLKTSDIKDPLHPPTFPVKGGLMEFCDVPERYFAFLQEKPKAP